MNGLPDHPALPRDLQPGHPSDGQGAVNLTFIIHHKYRIRLNQVESSNRNQLGFPRNQTLHPLTSTRFSWQITSTVGHLGHIWWCNNVQHVMHVL